MSEGKTVWLVQYGHCLDQDHNIIGVYSTEAKAIARTGGDNVMFHINEMLIDDEDA